MRNMYQDYAQVLIIYQDIYFFKNAHGLISYNSETKTLSNKVITVFDKLQKGNSFLLFARSKDDRNTSTHIDTICCLIYK